MPVVMTVNELERFLAAEFPQAFHPASGLAIEAVWDGGSRVRQAYSEASVRPGGSISGPTMMALRPGGGSPAPETRKAARGRRGHHPVGRYGRAGRARDVDLFDPATRGLARGNIKPFY